MAHFYIVQFLLGLILCFWPIFVDFQSQAAGLCTNNSINKDEKYTLTVS